MSNFAPYQSVPQIGTDIYKIWSWYICKIWSWYDICKIWLITALPKTLCVRAKLLQLCPTLCNCVDYSTPGYSVHRILQARIMEWDAMSSSRGSSRPRDRTHISYVSCICRRVFFFFFFLPLAPSRKPKDPLISVQSLSRVRLFATPWITARQASLSITNSRSSLKLMSIELVMPSSQDPLIYP